MFAWALLSICNVELGPNLSFGPHDGMHSESDVSGSTAEKKKKTCEEILDLTFHRLTKKDVSSKKFKNKKRGKKKKPDDRDMEH